MSTSTKRKYFHKAHKQLQNILDNLLKLSTDADIRRLVKAHNIKSVLDLMDLCQFNDWGRDLDVTTSISRPILEDQRMLLIELVLFQEFCSDQSSSGYFDAWEDTTEQQLSNFVTRHCEYLPESLPSPVRALDNFPLFSKFINYKPIIDETLEDNQTTLSHQDPIPDRLDSCLPSLVSPEPQLCQFGYETYL